MQRVNRVIVNFLWKIFSCFSPVEYGVGSDCKTENANYTDGRKHHVLMLKAHSIYFKTVYFLQNFIALVIQS